MISYDFSTWCLEILYYLCSILEVLVIVFFFSQLFKLKSDFTTSYYLLLNIDYVISFTICAFWFLYDIFGYQFQYFASITASQEWYGLFFYGFCNCLLGLNRCTALGFPLQHKKLWSRYCIVVATTLLLFPFLINCYKLTDAHCIFHLFDDECFQARVYYYLKAAILNIILNSLALLFVIYGISKARFTTLPAYKARTERRLVYQSVICAICQMLYYMFSSYAIRFPYDDDQYTIFYNIGYFFYIFQRYSNLIIIFLVHPVFRKRFSVFYKFDCLFYGKKRWPKTRVKVVSAPA